MTRKKTLSVVLILLTVSVVGYLSLDKGKVVLPISLGMPDKNSVDKIENASNAVAAKRVALLEKQLSDMSNQVNTLTKLVKQSSLRDDVSPEEAYIIEQDEIDTDSFVGTEDVDPLSAEGIAMEDEIQNSYISQVDDIYTFEEVDSEWASTMEADVLSKLADIDSFAMAANTDGDSDGSIPDVVVASFECRSQLCGTEIITGTMDEMLAYQNYMVDQTKHDLPSIVFSTIDVYGNKFRMKAYLARDEYEFPAPNR